MIKILNPVPRAHKPTEQAAIDAIKAAKGRRSWGLFATRRFCAKRAVPLALYRLACQLEAAQKGGF